MGFLSQLRDLLIEFPFDENEAYTLHHSQCQAISAYFVSTLERFFGTILRPLSCNSTSSSSTISASSTANASFRGWNSFSVFSDNRVLKLWSSRKNRSSSATLSDEYSVLAIIEELRSTPYAIEELYRVVKEAQKYLETCGDVDWWKSGIFLGSVREAKDVHFHDLIWCIVGLNLALHTVRGVNLESRSQFTRLDIAKGYAEMAILSSEDSNIIQCEEEDYKQLLLNLSRLKQKYDEMNFVRKRVMNFPDKVKYEMVQFHHQKLKDHSRVEAISSLYAKKPPESMQISMEDLVFPSQCHRISGGNYNSFYEASWLGIKVALKEFDYYTSKEAFHYEVDLLIAARCPFVIPLYGWSINMIDHTCYLIQEFVSSNLETLVAEKRTLKRTLHMPVVVDLMLQLSRAMEHLHANKLVHGDLCPANILIEPLSSSPELTERGYGRVKLSNFTPQRLIVDSFRMKNLHYIAPELWPQTLTDQPNYSFESDVYSFAMCFAYSLTGEEPFKGITSSTILKKMVEEGERPNLPTHCPLIFRELLMNCWSTDPSSRPSFAMINMSLRLFKVLIMKTRASDRSLDTAMLKEYSLSAPMISYIELSVATTGFSNKANNITMFSMEHGVLSDSSNVLVQSTRDSTNMRQLWETEK